MDYNTIRAEIDWIMRGYNLTIEYTFIPWSQSRNKDEKHPSLNYSVTVKQNGRAILTTLYSMGMGHAPAYKAKWHTKWDKAQAIAAECETGKATRELSNSGYVYSDSRRPILPDHADIWQSLILDSDVLYFASFEAWARDYGYDTDSRHAEAIYRDCLKIALQFNCIDERARVELREALKDY